MLLHVYPHIHVCFFLHVAARVETIHLFSMMTSVGILDLHTHLHLQIFYSLLLNAGV
jgi:hypothetical protein